MGLTRKLFAIEKTLHQGRGNFRGAAPAKPSHKVSLPLAIETFAHGPNHSPRAFVQTSPSTPKNKGVIIQEILDDDDQQAWANSEEIKTHGIRLASAHGHRFTQPFLQHRGSQAQTGIY